MRREEGEGEEAESKAITEESKNEAVQKKGDDKSGEVRKKVNLASMS